MIKSPRVRAALQALFVTFLWSTSWVLIKFGLAELPPLTFAALRYSLATVILLPSVRRSRGLLRTLSRKHWLGLVALGLTFYTFTQGGQFITLSYLPAVTFSLLLNFTSVLVMLFGSIFLNEEPARIQVIGLFVFLLGVVIYFRPWGGIEGPLVGFLFAGLTVAANAAASLLGRFINRDREIPSALVTAASMGVGAMTLLAVGFAIEDAPQISPFGLLIIAWLAVINTAFAFSLWNRTLQELTAMESSIINNSMLIQIALLAWLFLGESLTLVEVGGLLFAAGGIVIVNLKPRRRH